MSIITLPKTKEEAVLSVDNSWSTESEQRRATLSCTKQCVHRLQHTSEAQLHDNATTHAT